VLIDICALQVDEHKQLSQFVLHSALDMVDEKLWTSSAKYLRVVDRYANEYISSYVTPGHVRFLVKSREIVFACLAHRTCQ
jgi:hypothetical protein